MPYITTDRVKEIRNQLKKEFPQFKFSVTRRHHMEVSTVVRSGPIDFGGTYLTINHFWLRHNWEDKNPTAYQFLQRVTDIMNTGNGVLVEDSDYGTVPLYYINLKIGDWDRPYELK